MLQLKTSRFYLIAILLTGFISSSAHATLMMSVSDGTTTASYTDDGAGDIAGTTTGLLYAVPMIGNFMNVVTGVSKPLIGIDTPRLDLNSVNVSFGSGAITIMLTDTDFSGKGLVHFLTEIGGTLDGDIKVRSYVDDANIAFATSTLIAEIDSSSSSFSRSVNAVISLTGLYSITHVIELTHYKPGDISSFDLITTVPEPDALALFGLGILLLGGLTRSGRNSGSSTLFRC